MVLRGIFIGNHLYGGKFSRKDKGNLFRQNRGQRFDKDLDEYVNQEKK